ncbi:FAD-dependent monooxygenase [Amycolatopsis sp. YIM 10]|uniref:FAD-dependent monooxygenase n=1 Tax=Amycolatopsis sp. YIM 10 TaxID=2653857 RepID=UPI00128FEDBC|nr:FAD-dependent monooxygenase [Amycolatopsis sp. YIM 10]
MTENRTGRVLVVGMGVAGLATAGRLHAAGWTPVLIEKAPARRSGGYFVALFGAGQAAARRLGLMEHLHNRATTKPNLDLGRNNRSRPGMAITELPGEPWMMLRGDVEQAAFAALPDGLDIRYSTVPTAIEQDDDGVDVTLHDTAAGTSVTERFDLVVGADGLRSTVRELVFGPHDEHLRRLNYLVAAFQYTGTPPGLAPGQGATLMEPDRSMWVFAFADHDPTIMLTYRTEDVDAEFTEPPAQRLRAAFGPKPLGRTLGAVIDALDAAPEVLFDSVEQVRLDSWHRGRVVLVGDSAWCVTLYAGMGVSSGLAGAELLGTMLERHPDDVTGALRAWERALRPYVDHYQDGAFDDRRIFVMDNQLQLLLRRTMPLLGRSKLGTRLVHRMMRLEELEVYKNADIVGAALDGRPLPGKRTAGARSA